MGIRNIGKVEPRTKKNIIREPVRGRLEARARVWAVKVKPQGRKKVRAPRMTGEVLRNF